MYIYFFFLPSFPPLLIHFPSNPICRSTQSRMACSHNPALQLLPRVSTSCDETWLRVFLGARVSAFRAIRSPPFYFLSALPPVAWPLFSVHPPLSFPDKTLLLSRQPRCWFSPHVSATPSSLLSPQQKRRISKGHTYQLDILVCLCDRYGKNLNDI